MKLLDALLESRYSKAIRPPLDAGIVNLAPEAPWHPGVIRFRRRDQPVVTGESIGILSNSLQIILPLSGGFLFLFGWIRNRILLRRERRFDRFIFLVTGVQKKALVLESDGTFDHKAVQELHRQLYAIKDAALEAITRGESAADTLVSGLFAHIQDVRVYLTELDRCSTRRD